MPETLSFRRKLAYCLGDPGWQITSVLVVNIGIYYYLPPGGSGLSPQLSTALFFGVFTAYGVARLIGGVVDSLADPFVGYYSDRSRSPLGRRRSFLIYGIVPMVGSAALLFWPAGTPGSVTTFVFLTVMLAIYFTFFTVYVGPYLALIPEIAHTEQERVAISQLRAGIGGPAMVLFSFLWQKGVAMGGHAGYDAETSVRIVVVSASALAFLLCLLPIVAIDEKRFTRTTPSTLSLGASVAATARNRPFLIYLAAQIFMILGIFMLFPALPYISQVILGRDLGFSATLGFAFVPLAFVGFASIQWVANRLGTRNSLAGGVAILGLALAPLGLLEPDIPGGPRDAWNLMIVFGSLALCGLPLASLTVLPIVIIGQLVDSDRAETGADRSAMYFGVQGLFTKWVYGASGAIMSYLIARFGMSAEEPLGVLLIGPVAAGFCALSAVLFLFYPERAVARASLAAREARGQENGDSTRGA